MIVFKWDGFDCAFWGFNVLDPDIGGKHGRDFKWVLWLGPLSLRRKRKCRTRFASWGTDKSYRWFWRAAVQDAIFAFKNRYRKRDNPD